MFLNAPSFNQKLTQRMKKEHKSLPSILLSADGFASVVRNYILQSGR